MGKNKNYYIAVSAEIMFNDNDIVKMSGYTQLKPGCDKVWLEDELSRICNKKLGKSPKEIIITSLSEISKGLYDRLTNQEN